jgi:hypothetical protein
MSAKQRFLVSLDRDVFASVRKIAGARRVSEWLNEAAILRLQGLVAEDLEREYAPVPPQVEAEVERAWPA